MSRRVLFVEDDFITIDSVVTHLRILGHDVRIVDTAEDAVEALMWDDYEVVFLDVMLPPGNIFSLEETDDGRYTGLCLLELLRRDDRYARNRDCRVALVTNWREEQRVDASAERYRARLIEKPLALSTIEDFVNDA